MGSIYCSLGVSVSCGGGYAELFLLSIFLLSTGGLVSFVCVRYVFWKVEKGKRGSR